MPATNRLKPLDIDRLNTPGLYPDGAGLYLQVTLNARDERPAKSWVYRYMLGGKAREMGMGSLNAVSLKQARAKALDARGLRANGIDPIEARRKKLAQAALEAAKAITFKQAASEYVKSHRAGWRNAKHAAQWETTLATYADSILGGLSVQAIDTALVTRVLEQDVGGKGGKAQTLWSAKPETASRLRGRIESILDWAKARGYRDGENPARWRGHLDNLLPARGKVRKVVHHPALPYAEMPNFLPALRSQEGMSARALEFAILTAARTGEVMGARWNEIDFGAKVWTVPAERMKAGREHRVPLSHRAVEILTSIQSGAAIESQAGFVFSGRRPGDPLSNMAFLMLLRRMKRSDLTAHGFRSTFRDWAAERTGFQREVAEMCLAHSVGGKVEAAYWRGDPFEKRSRLMDAWAAYCAMTPKLGEKENVRVLRSA